MNQKNQGKKPLIVVGISLAVILLVGIVGFRQVYASLTASDQAENAFGLSDLNGTIKESFEPPTPTNPAKPGSTHKKEVTIQNVSTTPFFVRVLVTPEIQATDGTLLASTIGTELLVDLNSSWVLGEDGYYYYLGELGPDKTTPPLFTTVTLSSELSEGYKEATVTMQVKSETVSSEPGVYRTAWWSDQSLTAPNLQAVDKALEALSNKGK